ncbi:MAG: type VI secretion system membrane subunit TssM, partial [Pseudomonadota bacterium]
MMIRFLRPVFRSVWLASLFIAIVLSLCVWFLFPLFVTERFGAPFDPPRTRYIIIGVIWGITLFFLLIVLIVRWRRNRKMTDEMTEASIDEEEDDDPASEDLDEMRGKLREAMAELRKSKSGRRQLRELPWYVMIGPPGAGKTTAIVNSGLQFPLADTMGKEAIGGVGGTRNCDWWFTDNAVLIDTAGRYTTQESDQETDNAAWTGFLGILKKYRKRQPINGAIVAISLSDLSLQDETTQQNHAKAVRRRLNELREELGVRFPVYVLFTKADLIAGFTEFFDTLGKEARGQVWGFTFPLPGSKKKTEPPIAAFDAEFAALLARLNSQLLERMQSEDDPGRRALIQGFSSQLASVRSVAKQFTDEVFQDNKYERRHMLRGVYFTSGTQEGAPLDRLMMGMARI